MPTPHHEGKLIGGQMMNYEANPFRDYESITIDEQKGSNQQPIESGNGRTAAAAHMYE